MFTYQLIDAYVTIADLIALMEWHKENELSGWYKGIEKPNLMISDIKREAGTHEYYISYTNGGSGCTRKFVVDGQNVTALEVTTRWMS